MQSHDSEELLSAIRFVMAQKAWCQIDQSENGHINFFRYFVCHTKDREHKYAMLCSPHGPTIIKAWLAKYGNSE